MLSIQKAKSHTNEVVSTPERSESKKQRKYLLKAQSGWAALIAIEKKLNLC